MVRARKLKRTKKTVYDVSITYYTDGFKHTYAKRGFRTRREAQAHEIEKKEILCSGQLSHQQILDRKMPFIALVAQWQESYPQLHNVKPQTMAGYVGSLQKHWIPALGAVPICNITAIQIEGVLASMRAARYADSTINAAKIAINLVCKYALKAKIMQANPVDMVDIDLDLVAKEVKPYTTEQIRYLLDHLPHDNWGTLVRIILLYGWRLREALGLQVSAIHLDDPSGASIEVHGALNNRANQRGTGELLGTTKRKVVRAIPITVVSESVFRAQLQRRRAIIPHDAECAPLLFLQLNGTAYSGSSFTDRLHRFLAQCNLPDTTILGLRHMVAHHLFESGADETTVGMVLGHTWTADKRRRDRGKDVTLAYIGIQHLPRMRQALEAYHCKLFPEFAVQKC